ncbi:dihydrolipoyl dehydrogenase [Chloroflexota bacterium]
MEKAQIVIIGGGPGGYVASVRAAQLGASVILVEKDKVGGTCLNRGCIPTKSLLASTRILDTIKKAEEFGIDVKEVQPEFSRIMGRKEAIVRQLRQSVLQLFKSHKIKFIKGNATIVSPHKIRVETSHETEDIETDKIIIATGSKPIQPALFNFNHPSVLTSDDALELTELPKSLLIVGSGVIGLEFACIFNTLGVQITMVEMMDQILPTEDIRIAIQMQQILSERGIDFFVETRVEGITNYMSNGIIARLDNGEEVTAEKMLVSVGRRPVTDGIGLEDVGITTGQVGNILVNEKMETNVKGIYAVGDAVGGIMLAHVASAEGIIAAENAMGLNSSMDYSIVPSCVYTNPEIASVGLTADKAQAIGKKVRIGRFPFSASGKAMVIGEEDGFVRLVVDEETDQVIGAQIIGPHATELIAEAVSFIKWGLTAEQIGATIHAHPTLAESIMEAAENVHGKAIHVS